MAKGNKKIQVALRMGTTEHRRLVRAARDAQRTVSDYVRIAISEKVEQDEEQAEGAE